MELRITSRENEKVKQLCKLRDSASFRQAQQCFFAEGLRLCRDISAVCAPLEVYCTDKTLEQHPELAALPGRQAIISQSVAEKISDTRNTQGVFCVFPRALYSLDSTSPEGRWLILEHVQDPANLGALLRSAAAFGFDGVVFCADCADPYSPKAVRASMSAVARLKLLRADTVPAAAAWLKRGNVPLVAAALRRSVPLDEANGLQGKQVALLIGNEGNGLSDAAVNAADLVVRIPMAEGMESLNAAVAGGVLLWHFRGV